ncbi:MAG: PAS domain S-box protein [Clostridia bacterium]|jgi:PAS domain S-box-containing protein|nr:PAS domain S-box protein [Clostridia bacterium]
MANKNTEKYLKMLDQFPNPIWRSGIDGKCNFFNRSWLKFTGRSIDREMGDGWAKGVHPDDLDMCFNKYMQSFSRQEPFEMEYRLMHNSGEYRWILDCGSPVYEEDGTFAGYMGSCYDIHEAKMLRDKLNILNKEYETIFNTTQDPMMLIDVDIAGNFSYRSLSKAHEKVTGLTADMIIGRSPREAFGEKTGALLEADYRLCLKEKSVVSYEETLNFDSTERAWHTVLSPIIEDERVIQIVGARRDITEIKNAERALHKEKELFKVTVHSIGDGLLTTDKEGKITLMNKIAEEITGWTMKEAVGRPSYEIFNIVNGITGECCEDPVRKVLNTGRIIELEENTVFISKNGIEKHIDDSGAPIRDSDGNILGAVLVFRDVTHKKEVEKEVQLLHQAVEQSSSAVIVTDPEGKIQYVNAKFEKLTGYAQNEIMGKNPRILKSGIQSDEIYRKMWHTISLGEEWHGEFLNKKKNGEFYWALVSISPIKDKEGNIINFLAVQEDITERKIMEQALEDKNNKLSELVKKLESTQKSLIQQEKMAGIGQLAAGVAHEINNPLGFIISNFNTLTKYVRRYSEIVKAGNQLKESIRNGSAADLAAQIQYIDELEKNYKINYLNQDIFDLLEESVEGLERINKIVKGLRVFSRTEQEAEYEEFDLNLTIENTLLVASNEIKYHIRIDKNLGDIPLLYGIPSQINQVLLNIILNASYAIKTSQKEKKGIIAINTYKKDNCIVCEIIDNGPGIPKDIINQIFNPFFTTKPVGEGTGLGLSISYDIIKNKHNGDIEVESTEGIGTKFTLKFPCSINSE